MLVVIPLIKPRPILRRTGIFLQDSVHLILVTVDGALQRVKHLLIISSELIILPVNKRRVLLCLKSILILLFDLVDFVSHSFKSFDHFLLHLHILLGKLVLCHDFISISIPPRIDRLVVLLVSRGVDRGAIPYRVDHRLRPGVEISWILTQ